MHFLVKEKLPQDRPSCEGSLKTGSKGESSKKGGSNAQAVNALLQQEAAHPREEVLPSAPPNASLSSLPNNVTALPVLPGQKLRQARERQGLSVARVAEMLNLSQSYIQALELDDYDSLPGALYARGYIKNYCRLLDMPSNDIICLFNDLIAGESVEAEPASKELGASNKLVRGWRKLNLQWHVYGLLTGVAALCMISLWPNYGAVNPEVESLFNESDMTAAISSQLPDVSTVSVEASVLVQLPKSKEAISSSAGAPVDTASLDSSAGEIVVTTEIE